MKLTKTLVWATLLLGALYSMFIGVIIFMPEVDSYMNRTDFNAEKWNNWDIREQELSLRWNMVYDLTSKHDLIGMTASEVKDLLGEPDGQNDATMRYYLGMSGHGIDTGSLIFTLSDGKVTKYKVWHG